MDADHLAPDVLWLICQPCHHQLLGIKGSSNIFTEHHSSLSWVVMRGTPGIRVLNTPSAPNCPASFLAPTLLWLLSHKHQH